LQALVQLHEDGQRIDGAAQVHLREILDNLPAVAQRSEQAEQWIGEADTAIDQTRNAALTTGTTGA
jgi:hypothetical protein